MAIRPRGNRWVADFRDPLGNRHRRSFPSRREAVAWESAAKLAISENKPLPPAPTVIKKSPHMARLNTMDGLLNYLINVDWQHKKSAQTLIKNGRDVVTYFGAFTTPASITRHTIEAFKSHLASIGATNGTINRKLSALSKLLTMARDLETVSNVPAIKWMREEKTKFRFLDVQEEDQLLDYFRHGCEFNKLLMCNFCMFLLDTGARLSELFNLNQASFSASGCSVTFWLTKTGKPRTVPLTARCQAMLSWEAPFMAWLEDGSLMSQPRSGAWPRLFRKLWEEMQKALGWPDVTPHTLRHTCCSRLVMGGVDIKRVMEWMGHSNINTTTRYMQISPQGLADIVKVLEKDELLEKDEIVSEKNEEMKQCRIVPKVHRFEHFEARSALIATYIA